MKFNDWWEQNKEAIMKDVKNQDDFFMRIGIKNWFQTAWSEGWHNCMIVLKKGKLI